MCMHIVGGLSFYLGFGIYFMCMFVCFYFLTFKYILVMVVVYFESSVHAEEVATFVSEELYVLCLPILEAKAESMGMIVTEECV